MCDLEQRLITDTAHYDEFCVREVMSNECCRPWSIPNYVALLTNRTHCFDLTAEDVAYVQTLLTTCYPYYHNLRLDSECVRFRCKNVPQECTQYNAVYNMLHYLADNQFMSVNVSERILFHSVPLPGCPGNNSHASSKNSFATLIGPFAFAVCRTPRQCSCARPWSLCRWPRAPSCFRSSTVCPGELLPRPPPEWVSEVVFVVSGLQGCP